MDHRETLTTLPAPTQFCCAKHTLSPEKLGKYPCGPFTDEDLGRMLVRIQSAFQTHGPESLRPGGPERALLAVIPELLKLRAERAASPEQAVGFTLPTGWEKAGEFRSHSEWVNKAASWTRGYHGRTFMHDAKGRICFIGEDFQRARDENTFPVTYYLRTKP